MEVLVLEPELARELGLGRVPEQVLESAEELVPVLEQAQQGLRSAPEPVHPKFE